MPYRTVPLVTNEIYHVFNRSIEKQHIFRNLNDYKRILDLINFYRFEKPSLRFSHYNRLAVDQKRDFLSKLYTSNRRLVQILVFCVMPNHLHFILKQVKDNGISTFMSNVQNGFAKYFNTKNKRIGALFQSMFKCVLIESESQLIHTSRYIHLNPLTGYMIKNKVDLENYHLTSFPDYIGNRRQPFTDTTLILSLFSSTEKLKEFTFDQIDYQRQLANIKHLILE